MKLGIEGYESHKGSMKEIELTPRINFTWIAAEGGNKSWRCLTVQWLFWGFNIFVK